jgi:S1-C subfamily serine protease
LTSYHVIEGKPQQIILRHSVLGFFKATLILTDPNKDIALLGFQLDEDMVSPVSPLELGEVDTSDNASPVMILGYGSAGFSNNEMGSPRARIGALSQIVDTGTAYGLNLLLDIVVTSGDSGGPVINDRGQVIGMTRALAAGEKFVYATHEDDISSIIAK